MGHLCVMGTWEGAPLLVTPKDVLSTALEMDVCFHRCPAFGEHGGTLLSQGLSEKGKISLVRENFMRNLRDT